MKSRFAPSTLSRFSTISAFAFALLASHAPALTIAAPNLTMGVGGIVTEGKKPVKDATVYLSLSFTGTPRIDSTKTDKNGYYKFTNLNNFTFSVSAVAKGLSPSAVSIVNASVSDQGAAAHPTGNDIALKKKGPKDLAKAGIETITPVTTDARGSRVVYVQPSDLSRTFELIDTRGAVRFQTRLSAGESEVRLPAGLPEGMLPQVR